MCMYFGHAGNTPCFPPHLRWIAEFLIFPAIRWALSMSRIRFFLIFQKFSGTVVLNINSVHLYYFFRDSNNMNVIPPFSVFLFHYFPLPLFTSLLFHFHSLLLSCLLFWVFLLFSFLIQACPSFLFPFLPSFLSIVFYHKY